MGKEEYKYQEPQSYYISEGPQVFLQVIKQPHWFERASQVCDNLPVGVLTWTCARYLEKDENGFYILNPECSIIIENNQYGFNYDASCFEVLHTSVQKIRK